MSALKLDPEHLDSLLGMATLYHAKEMLQECIDAAAKAHRKRPDDRVCWKSRSGGRVACATPGDCTD